MTVIHEYHYEHTNQKRYLPCNLLTKVIQQWAHISEVHHQDILSFGEGIVLFQLEVVSIELLPLNPLETLVRATVQLYWSKTLEYDTNQYLRETLKASILDSHLVICEHFTGPAKQ